MVSPSPARIDFHARDLSESEHLRPTGISLDCRTLCRKGLLIAGWKTLGIQFIELAKPFLNVLNVGNIADQAFGPLFGFALVLIVSSHATIFRLQLTLSLDTSFM